MGLLEKAKKYHDPDETKDNINSILDDEIDDFEIRYEDNLSEGNDETIKESSNQQDENNEINLDVESDRINVSDEKVDDTISEDLMGIDDVISIEDEDDDISLDGELNSGDEDDISFENDIENDIENETSKIDDLIDDDIEIDKESIKNTDNIDVNNETTYNSIDEISESEEIVDISNDLVLKDEIDDIQKDISSEDAEELESSYENSNSEVSLEVEDLQEVETSDETENKKDRELETILDDVDFDEDENTDFDEFSNYMDDDLRNQDFDNDASNNDLEEMDSFDESSLDCEVETSEQDDGDESGVIPVDLKSKSNNDGEIKKTIQTPGIQINKDVLALYEISKEIMKSKSRKQLFDVILFTAMGQIGASSAAVIFPDIDDPQKWRLDLSRGIKLKTKNITFRKSDTILSELEERKTIIDIYEFKDNPKVREEFLKFLSIETKLLCPVVFQGELIFALSLGEKITIGEYTYEEMQFIRNICEISGVVADNLNEIENLRSQNVDLKDSESILNEIDSYEERIKSSIEEIDISLMIEEELEKLGISSYAFYFKDETANNFRVRYNEKADFISLRENDFRVSDNNAFTAYLHNNKDLTIIENPVNSDIIKSIFKEEQLLKINLFAVYPYIVKSHLSGFVIFMRSDLNLFEKNKLQMRRFSGKIFSYILAARGLYTQTAPVVDNYQHQIRRIQNTVNEAEALNIPIVAAVISIKNMKRYIETMGESLTLETLVDIKNLFEERLSESDYVIRLSLNKFMIIMPGKNKKSASTFCNSIKNELLNLNKNSEVQLLISYIINVIPDDIISVYELLLEFD